MTARPHADLCECDDCLVWDLSRLDPEVVNGLVRRATTRSGLIDPQE
jgi:hypothetical protein